MNNNNLKFDPLTGQLINNGEPNVVPNNMTPNNMNTNMGQNNLNSGMNPNNQNVVMNNNMMTGENTQVNPIPTMNSIPVNPVPVVNPVPQVEPISSTLGEFITPTINNGNVQPIVNPTIISGTPAGTPNNNMAMGIQNQVGQTPNIINPMAGVPTVEQSQQDFIKSTQTISSDNSDDKSSGPNYILIIVIFAIKLAALLFVFPLLLNYI